MPAERPSWKVFLSHTSLLSRHPKAETSYVAKAKQAISDAGHTGRSLVDDYTADPRPPADLCRQEIEESDVFVLVAGFQYGSEVPGDSERRSYTEFEFDEAGRIGRPRLVFLLADDGVVGTRELFEDDDLSGRQKVFRERLRSAGGVTKDVRSEDELRYALLEALKLLESRSGGDTPTTGRTPNPNLPIVPVDPGSASAQAGPPTAAGGGSGSRRHGRSGGIRRGPLLTVLALLVAVAVLATVVLVSCSPPPVDPCAPVAGEQVRPGDGTLRIGSVYPQTGPLAVQGDQLRAATEMAVRDVRQAGDVPGVGGGVTLDGADQLDEGDPTGQTSCVAAGRLVAAGVDTILGPIASASAVQMIPRVTAAGGLLIAPGTTAPELSTIDDDGRYFRTAPSDVMTGRILGDIVAVDGGDKVVVVARGDPYGRGLSAETVKELRGLGGRDVRSIEFAPTANPEDTDFRPIIENIRAQPTDAIVLIGFNEIGSLLRDLAGKGITPRETNIYATDGFLRDTFPSNPIIGGPELVAGLRGIRPLVDRTFTAALSASAGRSFRDYSLAANAYDAVVVTALAAQAAGSDDPRMIGPQINAVTRAGQKCTTYKACRDLLVANPDADIDYDGRSGPLDFTGDGEPCLGYYSIERYDNAGRLQEYRRAYGNYLCTGLLPPAPR